MAPRVVKGTSEERKQYMAKLFEDFYKNPDNAGKELSAAQANKAFIEQFGSMLRNKAVYQIRDAVKKQLKGGAKSAMAGRKPQQKEAARNTQEQPHGAALIEGTPDQLAFLKGALDQLKAQGVINGTVDHSTEGYVVVKREAPATA